MPSIRSRIIHLAHSNPKLRPHLMPLLKESGTLGTQIIVDMVEINSVLDDFERGELNEKGSSFYEENYGTFKSMPDLLRKLGQQFGCSMKTSDWICMEPGRIDTDWTTDEDLVTASLQEIELWKKGQMKLYNAHMTLYFKVGRVYAPSEKEIEAMFGISD